MIVLFGCYFSVSLHKGADFGNMYGVHRECMFYGVVRKFGGSRYRLSVYFACFTSFPPLVLGDGHNRHNEITLDRVGNMGHVFTDISPTHECFCVCCLFYESVLESVVF